MKYYVAFDGGGSKIEAILFDENLHMISHARSGSMNVQSTPRDLLVQNAHDCVKNLFEGTGVTEVENVFGVFSSILRDALMEQIKVVATDDRGGEALLGLLPAFVTGDAVIALSGTGSVVFYIHDNCCDEAGGFGSVINDEGSGYHMGRMAFAAAIRDVEGRGPNTKITECICRHFGVENFYEATRSVYSQADKSPTVAVASCAGCVGEAARMGDKTARRLLRECGKNLADQTLGLIKRCNTPIDVPVVIEGGHFKNDRRMVKAFINYIKKEQPQRKIVIPYFEPIIGAVLVLPYIKGETLSEEKIDFLKEEYKDFRYIIK